MQNNFNNIKKKKRKLKPFVKVILVVLVLGIIFFFLYRLNFFSSAKNFFENSYAKITTSIKNIIPHKDPNLIETSDDSNNDFVSIFKKRLPSQNITFASSTLMPNGDMKIFLKDTKGEAGYLFVNTKDNVKEVWTTFASVLIADPIKSLIANNLINLNYIDLRFQNKVFYKFNGLNVSATSTTSTSSATSSATTSGSTSSPTTNTH